MWELTTKINRYRRTYHSSEETEEILSTLPGWMELHNRTSVGYQFINALAGNIVEHVDSTTSDTRRNFHASSANHNEPYRIWKTYHDTTSGNIPPSAYVAANIDTTIYHSIPQNTISVDGTTVELINAEDQEAFFHGYPTRLTYDPTEDVIPTNTSGDITGITFVKKWSKVDSSGVTLIPEQDVYIINRGVPVPAAESNSTIIYDTDWNILDSYDYGLGTQDYDNLGKYEVISDPSGYQLEYNPIAGTLQVYDYINLSASGNPQAIADTYWSLTTATTDYVTTTTIAMSGTNPYNDTPIANSNYYAEYQYRKHTYPKQITTRGAFWNTQLHTSTPIFTSYPASYHGTVVRHGIAASPSGNTFALRVDPRDLRPGATTDVKFDYVTAADVAWDNTTPFDYNLAADSNFLNTASGGAQIYYNGRDITQHFSPALSGISRIYIPTNPTPPHSPPYTVRMYYNATTTYSTITAVQSFTTDHAASDPYPLDYMIDGGYLLPYSILPLSDANDQIQLALLSSRADQFSVVTDLLFAGIAYDKDKDCYWMLEANNMVLYKVRPLDGAILGKWSIFKPPNFYIDTYKSTASGVIDRLQDTKLGHPFINYEKDDGTRMIDGCVYYKDFLYILSKGSGVVVNPTAGGTGIYRLDTYNDRVMDMEVDTTPAEVHPHFPYPTGISSLVDITMDDGEDFVVAASGTVHRLRLKYDYALIDSTDGVTRGTTYYRSHYPSGVDVANFEEWGD